METPHPAEMEKLKLSTLELDPHVVRLVPREMAQRFHLVAVGQEENALVVAMEDVHISGEQINVTRHAHDQIARHLATNTRCYVDDQNGRQ